ncbi:MAG: NifB/NifX family molybdenum-iron cluster-binding protein [Bacilli bacterium]
MEKIAIANNDGMISDHFGQSKTFEIFDIEDGKIIKQESINNPGHKPEVIPLLLTEKGVNLIITGGIGGDAVDIFIKHKIKVCTCEKGQINEILSAYLDGSINSTYYICLEHHKKNI